MTQLPPSPPPQMPHVSPQPFPPQYGVVLSKPTKGLAVAGLVLGILSVLLPGVGILLALVGIVLSAIAISRRAGRGLAIAGLLLSILGLLIIPLTLMIVLPKLSTARDLAKTTGCGMNLSNIGKEIAVYQYQPENNGQFPPNLAVLIEEGTVLPTSLHCPTDGWSKASFNGSSYFYCAPEGDEINDAAVIACDVAPVHTRDLRGNKEARNYLRADLSVQTCTETEFQQLLQKPENRRFAEELAKGVNMTPQNRVTYTAPRDEK